MVHAYLLFFGLKEVSSSRPGQWERIAIKMSTQNIYYTLYAQKQKFFERVSLLDGKIGDCRQKLGGKGEV